MTNSSPTARQSRGEDRTQARMAATTTNDPLLPLPGGRRLRRVPDGTGIANLYIPRLGTRLRTTRSSQGTDRRRPREGARPLRRDGAARPGRQLRGRRPPGRQGRAVPEPRPAARRRRGHRRRPSRTGSSTGSRASDARRSSSSTDADGVPGREIVDPSDGNVLLPVPDHPGATPTKRADDDDDLPPEVHRDPADDRLHGVLAETVQAHGLAMPAAHHRALQRGDQLMYIWIWRHLPGPPRAAAAAGAAAVPAVTRAAVLRDLPVDRAAPADQPGHRAGAMSR